MADQEIWSFTKAYHHQPYPAIDPARTESSAKGKIVFITGGGKNIGGAIAESFAKANAADIVITGRTKETLQSLKGRLEQSYKSRVHSFAVDITDADALDAVFAKVAKDIGEIDVVVSNAGYSHSDHVHNADPREFWKTFEINTKGAFNVIQSFLKHATATENKVLISTNSGTAHTLATTWGPIASYASSKAATAKIHEYLQAERPEMRVYNLQPGIIPTELSLAATGQPSETFPDGKFSPLNTR
jgi:NADP-dependent 3-hydroxy acid dehydrogenase YdfG